MYCKIHFKKKMYVYKIHKGGFMITVYTGPMFSGKSAGLLNAYDNIWNKDNVLAFKPKTDTRDFGVIKSRKSSILINAFCIKDLKEMKKHITKNTKTIFIDEIQFLSGDVSEILKLSIDKDIDFHIAGLNMTSEQKPFGIMPNVLSIADHIYIYKAVCFDCNKEASFSFYEKEKHGDELVGSNGYLPLCRNCLRKRRKKKGRDKNALQSNK